MAGIDQRVTLVYYIDCAGLFLLKEGVNIMDVRTEQEGGKLLFQWDPQENIISIAKKNMIYDIKLSTIGEGYYEIIHKSNRTGNGPLGLKQ